MPKNHHVCHNIAIFRGHLGHISCKLARPSRGWLVPKFRRAALARLFWVSALSLVSFSLASVSLARLSFADSLVPLARADFPTAPKEQILLGRDLFFDPLLSGNRNIACATCHHGALGSADAVALSVGEGGMGLGKNRRGTETAPAHQHVPRNAPALYNLGADQITVLFHDGRVARDGSAPFGVRMPEGNALERPAVNLLAAQALLPLLSPEEMAGSPGENPIADAVAAQEIRGPSGAWAQLAARVEAVPAYRARFTALNGSTAPLHISDIGNAIGVFLAEEFRAINSPFDAYLRGDTEALSKAQTRGKTLFYGKALCSSCHAGALQTDNSFHAIGIPQIGPGKGHGATGADHGRAAITGDINDRYRFRTPSLRNVALTAPYGHSGAYDSLKEVVRHHLAPRESLMRFDPARVALPALNGPGQTAPQTPPAAERARIAAAITLQIRPLTNAELRDIVSFLHALTDPSSIGGKLGAPARVPSGLPVDNLLD